MAAYHSQSRDTSLRAERILIEAYRAMPVWEKARRITELNRTACELAIAGIRERYPDATEEEIRMRLAALSFDRATMIRLFDWDPDRMGL